MRSFVNLNSTSFRCVAALGGLLLANSAAAQTSDYRGVMEFQEYCAYCHETPAPGTRVPTRAELKAMPPTKIFESMTVGTMKPNAQELSEEQMRRIAEWLSGRPLVDIDRSADAMANACPDGAKLGNPLVGARWLGWSPDSTTNGRYQSADAAGLDAAAVPKLKLKWAFGLPGAASLRSQPVVGGGWLWVGSDNGMVYALDADTGCVHWSFESQRPVISTVSIGPTPGSPGRYAAYFGDFGANVYALDAETGEQLWTTQVDPHHAAAVSGSVVLDPAGERVIVPSARGRSQWVFPRTTSAVRLAEPLSFLMQRPAIGSGKRIRWAKRRGRCGRAAAASRNSVLRVRRSGVHRQSILDEMPFMRVLPMPTFRYRMAVPVTPYSLSIWAREKCSGRSSFLKTTPMTSVADKRRRNTRRTVLASNRGPTMTSGRHRFSTRWKVGSRS